MASRTVRSIMRWQWFDYALLVLIFVYALGQYKETPLVLLWPVTFAFYVWGNVRNVKWAYIEGYADGMMGSVRRVRQWDPPGDN